MGTPSDQHYHLRWNNHRSNFIEVFDQLLENELFTDATLAVDDGSSVRCHKMVLAACSPYFKVLFTGLESSHPIVVLKDVKIREVKAVLEYMYTGEVKVTQAELPALFKVAEILNVKGLVATETCSTSSNVEQRNEGAISTCTTSAGNSQNVDTANTGSAAACGNGNGNGGNGGGGGRQSSPPHSTSSPYYGYGKSPTARNPEPKLPSAMGWTLSQALSLQNTSADSAAAAAIQSVRQHSMFSSHYDNPIAEQATATHSRRKKITGMMRNRDTPILRNVLGQGHVGSSISYLQQHTDPHEMHYRNNSNGSANNESDDRRSSMDTPNYPPLHSPYATDTSMMDDDEKKISPKSYANNAKSGNCGPSRKPEWKRYKQYTKQNITDAIEAVRNGMSALKAARKFNVPSRTLYDKVKKLRIPTSRPFRRSANGSNACFPFGVGGNINGSIYGTISESENVNSKVLVDNPASLLETTFVQNQDNSRDRESMTELARRSSSPQPLPLYSHRQITNEEPLPPLLQQQQDSEENEVEDLSVSRRSEVGVIMSPSVTIKEEK